ncbi:MAG: Nramp family divalent metal transporter [Bacteroidota bacterium]
MRLQQLFGPSTLIAAAFIGPGTVTTCTLAGVQTSYRLLWVMLAAILATVVLQEMAARLGWVTQRGLGEAIDRQFPAGGARYLVFFLVIGAILVGNAAYEAGNVAGGVLGLDLLLGEWSWWPLVVGTGCGLLLYFGGYRWVERLLVGLVLLMSLCFVATVVLIQPDWSAVAHGFLPHDVQSGDFLLILALIGTTIVPYNLFLHASTISKKWSREAPLAELRAENAVAILLGGVISILIIITAAGSGKTVEQVNNAKDLAIQLQPLFGASAKWMMGLGLLAAGVSSALTAPLAAAYAAKGLFGWPSEQDSRFRAVWLGILLSGITVAMLGVKPILIIKFAQITNALLLPFIAGYLLYMANSKSVMGEQRNGPVTNVLGGLVVLVTLGLLGKTLVGLW